MMQIDNITKAFDGNVVLDGISFELHPGEITALVGRNGSGKTTLLRILAHITDGDSGAVKLDEQVVKEHPQLLENIAFLPDRFDYFPFESGHKIMKYYEIIYPSFDRAFVVSEALKQGIDLKTNSRSLSKGNKVLLGLLILLATNAKYLLVDEALDGIDVLNKRRIKEYLLDAAAGDRAVIVSSHQLEELQGMADRILYLEMNGTMDEVNESGHHNVVKCQVVVKETLPEQLQQAGTVIFQMGRVYTLLLPGPISHVPEMLKDPAIVQYDILPMQLEDYFYWEQGKENKHA